MGLPANIKSMHNDDVKKLTERVGALIPIIAERIHYAESRIAGINLQSTVLLAAGAAAFTASFAFEKLSLRIPIMLSGGFLFAFGFSMLFVASRQVNRYPFTAATKVWKWFYRDALQKQAAFEFSFWLYFRDWKKYGQEVRDQYNAQLGPFESQSTTMLLDDKENLWQDIQQVYVLHINEKYKNLFLSHLRKVFGVLSVLFVVVLALGIYLGHGAEEQAQAPHNRDLTQGAARIISQWRLVGDTTENHVDTATVLVEVSVVNQSDKPVTVASIKLIDRYGMEIPFTTLTSSQAALIVQPQGSGSLSTLVQFPMSLYSSMNRVDTTDGK